MEHEMDIKSRFEVANERVEKGEFSEADIRAIAIAADTYGMGDMHYGTQYDSIASGATEKPAEIWSANGNGSAYIEGPKTTEAKAMRNIRTVNATKSYEPPVINY